jgi:predicted anti-sigma-YlaC factor YlaD
MTRDTHNEARELIALGGAKDLSDAQQGWLNAHLAECAGCRDYAEAAGRTVAALRSLPLAAGSRLVRDTQMRVRHRAMELQHQQERLWVICACCVAVTVGTAFTTVVLWRGFEWVNRQVQLPGPVWQVGLVALSLMPAILAGILMLARGTYLAHENESLQD